jgi:hypothetical protein
MTLIPHRYPATLARSEVFKVTANGVPLDVVKHTAADHASFECANGPVRIEITLPSPAGKVFIRPLRLGIESKAEANTLSFTVNSPQYLQIEIAGLPLLYIYAMEPATPAPEGPHVRRFEGGKIHEVGALVLKSGEVCWIEAGAVVRGSIRIENASDVLIGGYGVIDGGYWTDRGERRRKAIVFDCCERCRVENILMLSPSSWMVVFGGSSDMEVRGVRQIADTVSSDGIDIVGSRLVRVTGCMLHNGDDNIAIKALEDNPGQNHELWNGEVSDVVVSGCCFYNIHGGSAMEIGYETCTDLIRDIRFSDIDVLAVHNFGSVFGIHTGDRAVVENITWENIRVEHHYDKLVDIRILWSRWNRDAERGRVRNLTLRNIRAVQIPPNVGYTLSVIAGYDADHPVTGVLIEDFELGGRRVTNADQLDLVTRHAHEIVFR